MADVRDHAKRESSPSSEGAPSKHESDVPRHTENASRNNSVQRQASVAALLRNPLTGMSEADVIRDAEQFVEERGMSEYREHFIKGALLARVNQRSDGFESINRLSEEEKGWMRTEQTKRWDQPFMLYFLVVLCAGSAIVQGMDQTAVNGAQEFYFLEFGIGADEVWLRGLLNGAPYLCSALIGCWTNRPLNYYFGRRGCIFVCCVISFITGFWMAAADSWYNLLIARFALGFAVGAKSSTTPVYAAECAPKTIRGALTMMWQMWTAFGIMLGFVVSVAFYDVTVFGENTQWRWMLASTSIPPMIVCIQVYFCPESPRWYMEKGKWQQAFAALTRLRRHEIQAARDMYYAYKLLEVEASEREGKNLWREFFTVRRNYRAAQSSFFVMFMQQFCGVNVIAYYSTNIFTSAGFETFDALLVSMGTGIVNFLFAIPAVYTIDTFGRRNLLLTTFPLMGICLLWAGFSFFIDGPPAEAVPQTGEDEEMTRETSTAALGSIAAALYAFMVVYSPGEGPVPFTYSAEAFPLYLRDIGMSFATATTWGFNFILSLTWPALVEAFTPTGAFGWYAGWNFFGWVYCYFLLPETKNMTLEELDVVFNIGNHEHFRYYKEKFPWYVQKMILRRDVEPFSPLLQIYDDEGITEKKSVDEHSQQV